jgi:hypothetical protein
MSSDSEIGHIYNESKNIIVNNRLEKQKKFSLNY